MSSITVCLLLLEPGEVEVLSNAEHDLSTNDPATTDRQPESSAECNKAASTNEPSPFANGQHEPSVESLRTEQHDESIDEQHKHAGPSAATWTTDVGSTHVRSYVAESHEWEFERSFGGRVHLFEPTTSASFEYGSKSIHAIKKQRKD